MTTVVRRHPALIGAALAFMGALLLLSPAPLIGALLIVAGSVIVGLVAPELGLGLVVVLFPIHPLANRIVQVDLGLYGAAALAFASWKEAALAAAGLGALWRYRGEFADIPGCIRRLRGKLQAIDFAAAALVLLVGAGLAVRHDSLALNATRLLLFPVGVYVVARLLRPRVEPLLWAMIGVASIEAAFAIVQSSMLNWSFVHRYWGTDELPVPFTFVATNLQGPRAGGTFASPNELAMALAMWLAIAAALFLVGRTRSRWLLGAVGLITVALAVTFSRSSIVAVVLALVVGGAVVLALRWISADTRRAAPLLIVTLLSAVAFSSVIYEQRGGIALIQSTFASLGASDDGSDPSQADTGYPTPGKTPKPGSHGTDSSTQGHMQSLAAGWSMLVSHPLGTGLGTVGSRAVPGSAEKPTYILESWYLSMGVSLGWAGIAWTLFFLGALFAAVASSLRRMRSVVGLALLAVTVEVAVISFVLPTMLEPQIALVPWLLAALAVIGPGAAEPRAAEPRAAQTRLRLRRGS